MEQTFGFDEAIEKLKYNKRLTRKGWNGKNQYIALGYNFIFYEGNVTNLKQRYCDRAIVFHGTSGIQVGWLASQGDMLADDWMEYEDSEIEE